MKITEQPHQLRLVKAAPLRYAAFTSWLCGALGLFRSKQYETGF